MIFSEVQEYSEGSSPEHTFPVDSIRQTILKLPIDTDSYIVIGGANLVLRGLREETPDIDLIVSEEAFTTLAEHSLAKISNPPDYALSRGADNTTVHIKRFGSPDVSAYTHLSGNGYYPMDFESLGATVEIIDGIPIASLNEVIASKTALAREKDIADLRKIAKAGMRQITIPPSRDHNGDDYQ